MKKIISLLLIVAMLLTALPAMADNVRTSGYYTYSIKGNGTLTIVDFDWDAWNKDTCLENTHEIFVPSMIDGYTVTSIGDEAFSAQGINLSFSWKITLPPTVTTIGKLAFFKNYDCTSINITDSIQSIGDGAFAHCRRLSLNISPTQPYYAIIDGCLYDKRTKELRFGSGDTTIPEGIKSIGNYAFYGATLHNGISFPSTLVSIGDYAFYECDMAYITRDNTFNLCDTSVHTIGKYAFSQMGYPLEVKFGMELTMPITLETIGEYAFSDFGWWSNAWGSHSRYVTIVLPEGCKITTIPEGAFSKTAVIINNPSAIKEIGPNSGIGNSFISPECFSSYITTIPTGMNPATKELPNTITSIESNAFSQTEARQDMKLSAALTYIASDAFCDGSTFIVEPGTYAEVWCQENGFSYTYEGGNNLDWLNN